MTTMDWNPAGHTHAAKAGSKHYTVPYTFGHYRGDDSSQRSPVAQAEAVKQEKKDARWWASHGEGEATLNACRNRDIECFWDKAEEQHINVRGQLKEAAKVNREKGLSSAGSKAALAGDPNLPPETCSLYKQEFGKPKSAEYETRIKLQQEAARQSRMAARSNKKMSAGSHVNLQMELYDV